MLYESNRPQTNLSISAFYQKLGYKYRQWIPEFNKYGQVIPTVIISGKEVPSDVLEHKTLGKIRAEYYAYPDGDSGYYPPFASPEALLSRQILTTIKDFNFDTINYGQGSLYGRHNRYVEEGWRKELPFENLDLSRWQNWSEGAYSEYPKNLLSIALSPESTTPSTITPYYQATKVVWTLEYVRPGFQALPLLHYYKVYTPSAPFEDVDYYVAFLFSSPNSSQLTDITNTDEYKENPRPIHCLYSSPKLVLTPENIFPSGFSDYHLTDPSFRTRTIEDEDESRRRKGRYNRFTQAVRFLGEKQTGYRRHVITGTEGEGEDAVTVTKAIWTEEVYTAYWLEASITYWQYYYNGERRVNRGSDNQPITDEIINPVMDMDEEAWKNEGDRGFFAGEPPIWSSGEGASSLNFSIYVPPD